MPAKSSIPIAERFWSKVDRSDECWIWTAARNRRGYGMFAITRRNIVLAHRFAYELTNGSIAAGVFCLHRCDNPACVRPDHLEAGSHRRNMRQMRERGRSLTGDRNFSHQYPELLPRGEQHAHAKLTTEDVRGIRLSYAQGQVSTEQIARRYGISSSHVCGIARRRTWKHVP